MGTGLPFDDILAAAQAGAPWAFEVLYRDLSPSVTGYLRLHGAAEPDDLASETFIGVFTGLAGFSGNEDALRAWVFTIAHRRLAADGRRRRRLPRAQDPRGPWVLPIAHRRRVDDWRRRSRRPQVADDPGDLTDLLGG